MKFQVQLVGLVFRLVENKLCVLVTKDSEKAPWALPSLPLRHSSPERILTDQIELMGVKVSYLEQLYTFTEVKGDSITMAYIVLAHSGDPEKEEVKWVSAKRVPPLKGIYSQIMDAGLERLRNKISYSRIATRLLPEEFTLTELLHVYEQILDQPVDKRNFRKKMESKNLVLPTSKFRRGMHRPALLYRQGPKNKNVPL